MRVPRTHLTAIMQWAEHTLTERSLHTFRLHALQRVTVNSAVLATLITFANAHKETLKINTFASFALNEAIKSATKSLTPAK